MEFNDNQVEILLQAVKNATMLPVMDYLHPDIHALIVNGLLAKNGVNLRPTAYGYAVAKTYEREQAEYKRGYKEGYDAGMYAGKHTGYSL